MQVHCGLRMSTICFGGIAVAFIPLKLCFPITPFPESPSLLHVPAKVQSQEPGDLLFITGAFGNASCP